MESKTSVFRKVKLRDCASFQEGYVNPSQSVPAYFGDEVKWLRAVDLNDSFVLDTSRKLSRQGYESAGKAALLFEPETLAISKSGTIGRLGILKDFMCGNRAVINIRVDLTKCDNRYIFFVLRRMRPQIEELAAGSVQRNLYCSVLGDIDLLVPPLREQQAIACVLGALDDKIELNRRRSRTLEAMARAIFQSWFVNFDPVHAKAAGRQPARMSKEIAALFPDSFENGERERTPKGWRRLRLREIADVHSGGTPNRGTESYWNGTIPWITPKSMTGLHVSDSNARVTKSAIGNGTRLVPKGSVLLMVRGMGLHEGMRISQAQREVTFNQDVKAIVAKEVDSGFLLFGLLDQAAALHSKVTASGHGTGVLPTEFLDRLSFVIPCKSSVNRLIQPLLVLNDQIAIIEQNSATVAAMRDALLPKLISGELRVPNAERIIERAL